MDIRTLSTAGYNFWTDITVDIEYGDPTHNIWDGTGALDSGEDWQRSGYGFESTEAMHTGTNGLDATGMSAGDKITFVKQTPPQVDANIYTVLQMWVNVRTWTSGKDINIRFYRGNAFTGNGVNLSDYVDTETLNTWIQAYIPLMDFNVPSNIGLPGNPAYIDELRLQANGDVGIWLDDVSLVTGIYKPIEVCVPEYESHELGVKHTSIGEEKVSMQASSIRPNMRAFPEPGNL